MKILHQPAGLAQVAALPLIVGEDGVARVLLLTSRETKRWVIPKGWPMKDRKPFEAAAQEAREEAGVAGHAKRKPVGSYSYFKRRNGHFDFCHVDVYMLSVERQLKTWREQGQREMQWFTLEEAADLVEEPGLVALFRDLARTGFGKGFSPRRIGQSPLRDRQNPNGPRERTEPLRPAGHHRRRLKALEAPPTTLEPVSDVSARRTCLKSLARG